MAFKIRRTMAGVKIGASTADKIAFHGVTPVAQRSGAAQAAVSHTVGAAVTTTVGDAVAATGSSNETPYGYTTAAQADAIVTNINTLRTDLLAMNTLLTAARADILLLETLVNELRAAEVAKGLIAGA